ncbi:uncharacterized protein LOC111282559 isoform X2 [Durio zibethinus]|uniref:Uncharacterized protein LOC111282559 isoform X2 n=1 Tax=Durio zibethinus TaxID=66656 RepID=A0A6P5XDK4_DURZI|nr:uncharacterized protein LOC111282559 isoform X2 [Durio zibethinus]
MGDNLRRNLTPSSDPQACSSELTRTSSDFSGSGVTIESFRDPTANSRPGQTMVWTNEKHNLYLDFLEASFVKQLHCSTSLCGLHPQGEMWEPYPTPELPAEGQNSSHQFSVLLDGGCQKINYKSNDPLLDSTADSCDILGSPWLYHFTIAGKSSSETFPVSRETVVPNDEICLRSNTNLSCKSARSSKQHPIFHSCNHSLGSCTSEVSDQNFVEEGQGEKTSCVSGTKRLKMMAMLDSSNNSQVVPHGKLPTVDDSIMSNASAKRGKKKLLSEHPESFSCPKSDIHYFLRES